MTTRLTRLRPSLEKLEQWFANVSLRNIGAVRNAGAKLSKFENLIFVDADTLLPMKTLRLALLALSAGCVGGGARVALSNEAPIPLIKVVDVPVDGAVLADFGRLGGWLLHVLPPRCVRPVWRLR